jgi:hypothetical protein
LSAEVCVDLQLTEADNRKKKFKSKYVTIQWRPNRSTEHEKGSSQYECSAQLFKTIVPRFGIPSDKLENRRLQEDLVKT